MATHILYLVRHGQYDTRLTQPDELEGDLTPLGHEQAALTATRLAGLKIDRLYSSDMRRAASTARALATRRGELPWVQSPVLRECFPYFPLGYDEVLLKSGYTVAQIVADQAQVAAAFVRFFQPAVGRAEPWVDVIATHGNVIRYFVCRVLGLPVSSWLDMSTYNCGITTVHIKDNGQMRLFGFNDVGHLPAELVTHNMTAQSGCKRSGE